MFVKYVKVYIMGSLLRLIHFHECTYFTVPFVRYYKWVGEWIT